MSDEHPAADDAEQAASLLSFTIDASTARIVKLEALEPGGGRHELSAEERTQLLKRGYDRECTLERVVERAFEAGIACVLDGGPNHSETSDSFEDVELTHRLLHPLIERSEAKELIARDAIDRAILDTLIEHSQTKENP